MATIQTRKNKTGESYRVGYYDENGKFKFTPSFKKRAGAEKIAHIIETRGAEVALRLIGAKPKDDAVTLREWFDKHLERKSLFLEAGTIAGYKAEAERTWLIRLGDLPLEAITRTDVYDWVRWQASQETHRSAQRRAREKSAGLKKLSPIEYVSPKTIQNAHALLSHALEKATYEEPPLIANNPAKGVDLPRESVVEEKPIFTRDEWNEFYSAMADYYKPFIAFLLVTGCRIGEATAVRVGDLNFKSNTVSVVRAWKKAATGRVIGAPKSARSRRVVMVDAKTMSAFADLCKDRDPSELLFIAPRGGRIHPHRFNERQWWPAMQRAGIDKHLTPHSLRHTFASWQLMAGTPPQVVQMRMGHSSLSTTSKVYAHLLLDAQQHGADAMALDDSPAVEPLAIESAETDLGEIV